MKVVSFSEARNSLKTVLDRVVEDADYTIVTRRDADDVVVMSLESFNSLMETVHLLKSPANAAHLERSIALDPDLVIPGCEELYRFHSFQADSLSADIYLEWRQNHLPKQWRSKLERKIEDTDRFIPHDLAPDLIREICQKLVKFPAIERAYLVCKPMQIFADRSYVLGIQIAKTKSTSHQNWQSESELECVAARLQIELNLGKYLVLVPFDRQIRNPKSRLIKNIQKIPNARIF